MEKGVKMVACKDHHTPLDLLSPHSRQPREPIVVTQCQAAKGNQDTQPRQPANDNPIKVQELDSR